MSSQKPKEESAAAAGQKSTVSSAPSSAPSDDIIYIYVMAHGAGSRTLDPRENFISFNDFATNFTKASQTPFIPVPTNKYPLIYRLTTTLKSVVSDFASDIANVNHILEYLTNPALRERIRNKPKTKGTSAHEGHRTFDELYDDMQQFGPNVKMYNEMVEVEVGGPKFKRQEIRKGKGTKENPGGFGIFVYRDGEWIYLDDFLDREGVVNSILLTEDLRKKDISILEITYKLVELFGTRIAVINPNCSPPSEAAIENEREWYIPYSWKGRRLKMMDLRSQFLLGTDLVGRVFTNFQGIKKSYDVRTGVASPPGKPKDDGAGASSSANASGKTATLSHHQEDRTGIIDPEDFSIIISEFFYFFKDYYDWNTYSPGTPENQELLDHLKHIFGKKLITDDMYAGKFLLILMLGILLLNDKRGGIIYENDSKLMEELADESSDDDDDDDAVTGKGRVWLWKRLVSGGKHEFEKKTITPQIEYGAMGRRQNQRSGDQVREAQRQLDVLIEAVYKIAGLIESKEEIKSKAAHFLELLLYSKQFAEVPPEVKPEFKIISGGKRKRKKRKTRKRKRKTKRNSPHKKRRTRSKSSKRRKRKRKTRRKK